MITTAEILQLALKSGACALRVDLPGRVVRVKSTGRVDVRVELRTARPVVDEQYEYQALPELLDVPVVWPSTQAAAIVMKLAPGDPGQVLFHDHALGAWLTAGALVNPAVPDAHGASGATFTPGLWPGQEGPDSVTDADVVVTAGDIRLGSVSASDPIALKSDLDALKTYLDAHAHTGVTTGPGSSGPPAAPAPSPAGSTKVKSE